jgi:hypothetical protein
MLIRVKARLLNGTRSELESIFKKQVIALLNPLFVRLELGGTVEIEKVLDEMLSEESPAEMSDKISWGWKLFEEAESVTGEFSFYIKGVDVKPEKTAFEMQRKGQKIQMEIEVIA